jgi:hypothetical protein
MEDPEGERELARREREREQWERARKHWRARWLQLDRRLRRDEERLRAREWDREKAELLAQLEREIREAEDR